MQGTDEAVDVTTTSAANWVWMVGCVPIVCLKPNARRETLVPLRSGPRPIRAWADEARSAVIASLRTRHVLAALSGTDEGLVIESIVPAHAGTPVPAPQLIGPRRADVADVPNRVQLIGAYDARRTQIGRCARVTLLDDGSDVRITMPFAHRTIAALYDRTDALRFDCVMLADGGFATCRPPVPRQPREPGSAVLVAGFARLGADGRLAIDHGLPRPFVVAGDVDAGGIAEGDVVGLRARRQRGAWVADGPVTPFPTPASAGSASTVITTKEGHRIP
jgi:hypothetical protein